MSTQIASVAETAMVCITVVIVVSMLGLAGVLEAIGNRIGRGGDK